MTVSASASSHRPLVVKVGGRGLNHPEQLTPLLQKLVNAKSERGCVLVHGGGALIDTWLQQFGHQVVKQDGLRVTQQAEMPIIAGALAGALNTQLVAQLNQLHPNQAHAVGVSLADDAWCHLTQDTLRGQVGIPLVEQSAVEYLAHLLAGGYLPVVNSVGVFANGRLANVNADLAAAAVAAVLDADLLLLTDVDAILDASGTVLDTINPGQAQDLIASGVVVGGMKVKLEAALAASTLSRRTTAVAAWYSQAELAAHFTGHALATRILGVQNDA